MPARFLLATVADASLSEQCLRTGELARLLQTTEWRESKIFTDSPKSLPRERGLAPAAATGTGTGTGTEASEDSHAENPGNNLFVNGLSHRTEDKHLEEEFGKYGKITKCAVMYDPHSGQSRCFAFVSFEDVAAAEAAMEAINRKLELHGKILSVSKAKRARARSPTPGQYRGPPKTSSRYDRRGNDYDYRYDRGGDYYRRDRYERDRDRDRSYYRSDRDRSDRDRDRERRRRSPY
ncbi:hypothetical protein HK104_009632 [Borealophlyctis nickersoniae]|nr:hypothetical protein HK104_009632 [Borealophlyctis nickersoniae]